MTENLRIVRVPSRTEGNHPGKDQILLLCNGQVVTNFPPEVAEHLARGLISLSREILNDRRLEQQILDQAILRRAGVPIGLSNNVAVQKEAAKEAQWNGKLRRFMPAMRGIPSNVLFGLPRVRSSDDDS